MIRVAARGSKLSRAQAELVMKYLKDNGYDTVFIDVRTRGDLFSSNKINEIGKGVFEKEVNEKVLSGEADLAVHSMKDMESSLHNDLEVVATLPRASPLDVLINSSRDVSIYEMDNGEIGTSSQRRSAFVKFTNPLLKVKELRGNLDTRVSKLKQGNYDAIIVAEAGIQRLKLDVRYREIEPSDLTPAPNQGIIAVVARRRDQAIKSLLQNLSCEKTFQEAIAEREVSRILGTGCNSSLGVLFTHEDETLHGIATFYSGKMKLSVSIYTREDPKRAGEKLARKLRDKAKENGLII